MVEKHEQPEDSHEGETLSHDVEQMDTADKSLSDALRISFAILKIIMVIVIIAFFASGFQTIGPDEQGLVLRFGKIQAVDGEGGVALGPGLRWIFPYPIDELVKIPVERRINLPVNSFWYNLTAQDILGRGPRERLPGPTLDPTQEGYCLTRGEGLVDAMDTNSVAAGSDYNIVHSRWQVTYKIRDIQTFFQHVYVREAKPGQAYGDLMEQDIKPLLRSCFEDAVVDALVRYTIDEALESQESMKSRVASLVQAKLDDIESGLQVVNVNLNDIIWPRQPRVDDAFNRLINAKQEAATEISQAGEEAETILTQTAGEVADTLAGALHDETIGEQDRERLWSQLAGEAQTRIANAIADRTETVESASSAADYFRQLLPEFRARPQLVIRHLYLETIQEVLKNIDEKFLMQYSDTEQRRELRILLNKIPRNRSSAQEQAPRRDDGSF